MKKLIPVQLLLRLFRVAEARSRREKRVFRRLWTQVWLREGYAHEGEQLSAIEPHYDALMHQSTDLILWVLGVIPIGTMRIVWEGPEELPVLRDFDVIKCWGGPVVEFTLLTLKEEWRGLKHAPSFLLMRAAYRRVKKTNVQGIVIAADERLFALFQKVGIPFIKVGPAKFYEGSDTIPAYLNVLTVESDLRKTNPPLAEFFFA